MSEVVTKKINTTLVPVLRFKDFNVKWGKTTLGNLFTFKNGLNSDKEKYGSGTKFINVLDIIGEDVITYDSIIGKVKVTENELEKNEVIYGDVLFQRSSETREEVGQANVYVDENHSAVFGGFVIRGRKKKDYNPYFINYLLKTSPVRKEITTKSGGSTRYNVGQSSLSEVFVMLPSLPEQQKIASFLTAVDEKIQQLTKKKALLENYKKGVMQQLFSGKLRFKDSNGNDYPDWEEKRLDAIIDKFVVPMRDKPKVLKGEIPWCRIEDFDGKYLRKSKSGQGVSEETVKEMNLKVYPVGTLLVSCSANLGFCAITEVQLITNQTFIGLVPDSYKVDVLYLLYVMRMMARKLNILSSGTTISYLSRQQFEKFKVPYPSLKEQQKIASYLSRIDTKIETVNNQITQTQQFKKGLLQQMFV